MDKICSIFHGLLRPRHKRNHRHLYHRRQIGKKMSNHNGQRVAFAVVIPTNKERKRQDGDKSINQVFAVWHNWNETMLKGIKERRNQDDRVFVLDQVHATSEIQPIFRQNGGEGQEHQIDDGERFRYRC